MPDDPAPVHLLAAWGESSIPARASDAYVRQEFDRFAEGFDKTLAMLEYQAPKLVADLLEGQRDFRPHNLRVLDAGCGTGLIAPLIQSWCDELVGVDLSPKMVNKARARAVYDQLVVGEMVQFMRESTSTYDLISCVDTLVYFGDLQEALEVAVSVLEPGGWIGFSVELAGEEFEAGYSLTSSGRYAHTENYLRKVLKESGLCVVQLQGAVLRRELTQPVNGLIVAAQKQSGDGHR
jgi:predicted TPR repeat methyltransferase